MHEDTGMKALFEILGVNDSGGYIDTDSLLTT